MKREVHQLIAAVEQAFRGAAWHGPNLSSALRGVTELEAGKRIRGRHSIWELTLHCSYWKHVVWQRLTGERDPFPRVGVHFPARTSWAADRRLLTTCHSALLKAGRGLTDTALGRAARGSHQTPRELLVGIAHHDTYHAGQISMLARMIRR